MTSWSDFRNLFSRLRVEKGQGMAEYAVILSVITVVVVGALLLLSGEIGNAIDKVTDVLKPDA